MSDLILAQHDDTRIAATTGAIEHLTRDLAAYAAEHGGLFTLFGSAARGEQRGDSDVDILVDFPQIRASDAWSHAERRALALGLVPDLIDRGHAGAALLSQIDEDRRGPVTEQRLRSLILLASESATRHFTAAVSLFEEGGFDAMAPEGYRRTMAFLHAMQVGHTSLESALQRLLVAQGIAPGTDAGWHARMIVLAGQPQGGAPAVLTPEIAQAADVTRRFRHVAMHNYDFTFEPAKAAPAVAAAKLIAGHLHAQLDTATQDGA
jgi:predicted nucleotidyltransferase